MFSKARARVLTWNLERKSPTSPLGSEAVDYLFSLSPDVMSLTEARTTFPLRGGHTLWSEPPRGRFADDERKLLIWSKEPWRDIDRVGIDGLDTTRFIAATTDTPIGPVRVVGTCIPWHMCEVTYPIDVKRKPWELHIAYLERLAELLAGVTEPTIAAGDFNQRVPRISYGNRAAAAALTNAFEPFDVVTAGLLDGCERIGIDHVAVSRHLAADKVWGWPNVINGKRMTDHDGAGAVLIRSAN